MNKRQIKASVASAVLGVLSPLAMAVPASAATNIEWVGYVSSAYAAFSNWSPESVPVLDTQNAVFGASSNNQTVYATAGGPYAPNKIIFNGNNPGTSSKSYSLTGSIPFTLKAGIDAVMTGSGGDHSIELDLTLGANQTFMTSGSNTLSVGGSATTLDLDTFDLTLDAGGGTISILGSVIGSGNIVKSGTSKVNLLAKAGTGYTGGLNLNSGEVSVNDALGLAVTVAGGTLKGTGTVGAVTMSSGTIAPGASPGVLNTGSLTYTGGTYAVELGGTAAGEFDQTNVTGTVSLGTATNLTITLTGGYAPAINDAFIIVNNDGTDAVTGNFNGLADGDKIIGDYTYQINYDGGDGNDVILLVTGNPGAPDTGAGSLITNPYVTLAAAAAVLVAAGAIRFAELKKAKVRN